MTDHKEQTVEFKTIEPQTILFRANYDGTYELLGKPLDPSIGKDVYNVLIQQREALRKEAQTDWVMFKGQTFSSSEQAQAWIDDRIAKYATPQEGQQT